jgi:hypothetical protein
MKEKTTYIDETRTGVLSAEKRGLGRATIAANYPGSAGLEWIERLSIELPKGSEIKSDVVLPIMSTSPVVEKIVWQGIEQSNIAIIDFSEYPRKLIKNFCKAVNISIPKDVPVDKVWQDESVIPKDITTGILQMARKQNIEKTVIPHFEWLVRNATEDPISGLRTLGDFRVLNRDALKEMNEREFQELIGRFTLAVAEALRPDFQSNAVLDALTEVGFIEKGAIEYVAVTNAMSTERIFDYGSELAFKMLQEAHARIKERLDACSFSHFVSTRPSNISQEDSVKVLGLQAADLSAALARMEFEGQGTLPQGGIRAVKNRFEHVILNDEWC